MDCLFIDSEQISGLCTCDKSDPRLVYNVMDLYITVTTVLELCLMTLVCRMEMVALMFPANKTFTQCCINVGPASQTQAQH